MRWQGSAADALVRRSGSVFEPNTVDVSRTDIAAGPSAAFPSLDDGVRKPCVPELQGQRPVRSARVRRRSPRGSAARRRGLGARPAKQDPAHQDALPRVVEVPRSGELHEKLATVLVLCGGRLLKNRNPCLGSTRLPARVSRLPEREPAGRGTRCQGGSRVLPLTGVIRRRRSLEGRHLGHAARRRQRRRGGLRSLPSIMDVPEGQERHQR